MKIIRPPLIKKLEHRDVVALNSAVKALKIAAEELATFFDLLEYEERDATGEDGKYLLGSKLVPTPKMEFKIQGSLYLRALADVFMADNSLEAALEWEPGSDVSHGLLILKMDECEVWLGSEIGTGTLETGHTRRGHEIFGTVPNTIMYRGYRKSGDFKSDKDKNRWFLAKSLFTDPIKLPYTLAHIWKPWLATYLKPHL